jgi:RNA polymerase sigma-70 factor (sigma-E family)
MTTVTEPAGTEPARAERAGPERAGPERARAERTSDQQVRVELEGARRDRDAEFTAFVRRHQQDLLRTAWLLVGERHRAEELTQQALVRTYAAWTRAGADDPLAYARRVLVNLRIDTWRRRRREVLVADVPESTAHAGRGTGPSAAERHADRDQLVRALATLTARQRRVVVLRHFVGMAEAEVADDLGVSVGTVKSTSSRALATLRTVLADDATRHGSTAPEPRRS